MDQLQQQYDAILLTLGKSNDNPADLFGVETKDKKIKVAYPEYTTTRKSVFAAGSCIGSKKLMIRAVADGKEAANAIQSHLLGHKHTLKKEYNHQMGRLQEQEMEFFLKQVSGCERIEPKSQLEGLDEADARNESSRCLHCDCRKAENCKLRDLATDLGARRKVWQSQRKVFEQITGHEKVIFEPGKCVKCGLCIQTVQKTGEPIGLSFEGRGFGMKVVVPLEKSLTEGLQKVSTECAKICPTGALALNEMIE